MYYIIHDGATNTTLEIQEYAKYFYHVSTCLSLSYNKIYTKDYDSTQFYPC